MGVFTDHRKRLMTMANNKDMSSPAVSITILTV